MKNVFKKLMICACSCVFVFAFASCAEADKSVSATPEMPKENSTNYGIAPTITVDCDTYSLSNLPNAVIGKEYKIFTATAKDVYGEELAVRTNLYLHYYSQNSLAVNIIDDTFIPETDGVYTVVYSTVDSFGTESKVYGEISCVKESRLSAALSGEIESGFAGQELKIADISFENNIGNVEYSVYAYLSNGNVAYDLTDKGYFTPTISGEYNVVYYYNDFIEKKEISYKVQVLDTESPILSSVVIPKYMIVDSTYAVPTPQECYYSTQGKRIDLTPSVWVVKPNDPDPVLVEDEFVPDEEGTYKIIYEAECNGTSTVKEYESIAVDVGFTSKLKMENYFYGAHTTCTAGRDSLSLSTSHDGASVDFINYLPAEKLSFVLGIDEVLNHFDRVVITLTDALYADLSVKFSFVKDGAKARFYVNDGEYASSNLGFEVLSRIEFKYDNESLKAQMGGSGSLGVNETQSGNAFLGFISDKVELSLSFGNVTDKSLIYLYQINNQSLYNESGDGMYPYIVYYPYSGGIKNVGDTIRLERIYVGDVLDAATKVNYCVKKPDGSYAKDIYGVEIKDDYDCTVPHSFVADTAGKYVVNIVVSDSAANEEIYSYSVDVAEKSATTVVFSSNEASTVKVGTKTTLRRVSVENYGDKTYTLSVVIFYPDLSYVLLDEGNGAQFVPTASGTYSVYYYVVESDGNTISVNYNLYVE